MAYAPDLPMDGRGSLGRGVIVLGSHRSGTSAITGVIDSLGLPARLGDDQFRVTEWNARGNFESRSLARFDEELLRLLGGAWWAPPAVPPGWARSTELEPLRRRAAEVFAEAHPARRWAWKDPRACVLMPFWDSVLGARNPRMVVLRHPVETARSLRARNQIPPELCLAMWERNLGAALRDSAGRPVLVTTFDDLLDDVAVWCEEAAAFLGGAGIALDSPLRVGEAARLLDASLRHHRPPRREDDRANDWWPIWNWAVQHRGAHAALDTVGLPAESSGAAAVLEVAARQLRDD